MVGIGSTIGSGVFVLTGLLARDIAGPYTPLCWLIAGVSSLLSAYSYAELSWKYPESGSSYIYVFNVLGEMPAYISAACLTLEYGISASAVARSWGEKLDVYTQSTYGYQAVSNNKSLNIPAASLMLLCVIILYCGIDLSKKTINFFTILKIILVAFMITAGFIAFNPKYLIDTGGLYNGSGEIGKDNINTTTEKSTTSGTITAIFAGATTCFFGYVGYDEVCCLSGECINRSSMTWAVFGTITTSMVLYILASISLLGLQSYHDINEDEGFSQAFISQNTYNWKIIGEIVAIGELIALPIVVLISFMAQPRLLYAMSKDNLMPKLFSNINKYGNLSQSILLTGLIFSLLALIVPFTALENMVSAGILVNFNLTNIAYILMRSRELFGDTYNNHNHNHNQNAFAIHIDNYIGSVDGKISGKSNSNSNTDSDNDNSTYNPPKQLQSMTSLRVNENDLCEVDLNTGYLSNASTTGSMSTSATISPKANVYSAPIRNGMIPSTSTSTSSSTSTGTSVNVGNGVIEMNLIYFNVIAIILSILLSNALYGSDSSNGKQSTLITFSVITFLVSCYAGSKIMKHFCGSSNININISSNSNSNQANISSDDAPYTLTYPYFPLVPLTGILVNWFLLAQLPWSGFLYLGGYYILTFTGYLSSITCCDLSSSKQEHDHEQEEIRIASADERNLAGHIMSRDSLRGTFSALHQSEHGDSDHMNTTRNSTLSSNSSSMRMISKDELEEIDIDMVGVGGDDH